MKRFLPYFRLLGPVKYAFFAALLFGAVHGVASGVGLPFATQKIFPVLFGDDTVSNWTKFLAVLILPTAFVVRGVAGFLNVYLISYCGIRVLKAIQLLLFEKLQRLPLGFFQRHRSGDLMARLLGDTGWLQSVLTRTSNDLIKQPVTFMGAMGYLIYLSARHEKLMFVVFFAALLPLLILPVRFAGRRILTRARQMQDQAGNLSSHVAENIGAVKEIRLFNLQEPQTRKFREALDVFQTYQLKVVKYSNIVSPTVEVLSTVAVAAAVFYAASSGLTLEALMPLIVALFYSYAPLRNLAQVYQTFKGGTASLDRIEAVLHHEEMVPEPQNPLPLVRCRGELEFRDVTFAYDDEPVLVGINERIAPGEIVALVGPSGAGKSTFVNLIPRLYDVSSGQVLIDDVDVRRYSKIDLRGQIAIVPQDAVLFNDSIKNNILIGRPRASDEEVINAAKEAYAHDFIVSLHDSYDTFVGERGTRLSGGQKQRIALARAFLKNAPLLILDEATSSLDSESETMIQKALTKLVVGRTTLIIAHRFSTLKIADRILFFESGRLIAQGTHDALYATVAPYRSLYDKQL